jgi:transposase
MKKLPKLTQKQKKELDKFIKDNDHSNKEVKRAQAIIILDKQGKYTEVITAATGYSERQAFDIRKRYLVKGITAIEDPHRKNPKELLTKKQRDEIVQIVKSRKPTDFDYKPDYWSTAVLADFIYRHYHVKYKSKTSIYILFKKASFSYHKPGRVYENRDEEEVANWKKEMKPKVKKAYREKDTVVLCEDEMILSSQTTFQKIWLPANDYPKIEISNTKVNRSIYGFLNIKTGQEHAFKAEKQNMFITKDILKELRKIYPTQKLYIIWDGAGWHRGSEVQKFIESDGNIVTDYFPRYSPEENPQEHVWKKGRSKVTHNEFIKNIDKATDKFVDYLNFSNFGYKLLGLGAVLEC